MSSGELLLKLFDFFWFENGFFSGSSPSSTTGVSKGLDVDEKVEEPPPPKLCRTPTVMVRSFSDQALSSKDESSSDSSSPMSVLSVPKLQTILSGKEVAEFAEVIASKVGPDFAAEDRESHRRRRRSRGGRKGSSRSLSELEYEELKGFMDLGFQFSDDDKASSLVSIIPGLQRLGRKDHQSGDEEDKNFHESTVSRPYLSEAWDFSEKKKTENPLTNWRIPAFGNEMELKDHLKFWAHTVASTVR